MCLVSWHVAHCKQGEKGQRLERDEGGKHHRSGGEFAHRRAAEVATEIFNLLLVPFAQAREAIAQTAVGALDVVPPSHLLPVRHSVPRE